MTYRCIIHCYVLMSNHFHLIVKTPEANLSKVMHYLSSSYTTYINIKKGRSRHLFQGTKRRSGYEASKRDQEYSDLLNEEAQVILWFQRCIKRWRS